jgi:glycosyltransferase involved in cell wall biosynthesis
MAGPAGPDVAARLSSLPVEHLGPVTPALVPGLLRAAAVGIVPHQVTDLTRSMDPMKVYEYLAAGLPVVTTPIPDVATLSPRVRVAAGVDEMVAALEEAAAGPQLSGPDPAVIDRDWSVVARRLLEHHGADLVQAAA